MKKIEQNLNGEGLRIGIVQSRFNADICDGLLDACLAELHRLLVRDADITLATVPGALESPLVLAKMARTSRFDGLIALGAIVRGETYHFEIVSNESARGIAQVQLETGMPIANAILTTEDDAQAFARMRIKGTEAAQVAIEMINLARCLSLPQHQGWKEQSQATQKNDIALTN